jgi:hypothetical protein
MVVNGYHKCLDRILSKNEQHALKAFNEEVIYLRGMARSLQLARVNALFNLKEDDMLHLAVAFRRLYPHWFTNGRGTALDRGDTSQLKEVCLDVIGKLNASSDHCFADIARLFDLCGDNTTPTGRRPLAHTDKGQGHKRTRTRTRRTTCRYHSDKAAVAGELCCRCYNRWNSLVGKNVLIENFPGQAVEEIMNLPRPGRNNPLHKQARKIGKKYKAMEENR